MKLKRKDFVDKKNDEEKKNTELTKNKFFEALNKATKKIDNDKKDD